MPITKEQNIHLTLLHNIVELLFIVDWHVAVFTQAPCTLLKATSSK
jgi:hypothetical protein